MSKKSQMEMMGIAIVVVLLSLIFLFVIQFVVLKEPTEQSKDFKQSELATNFLNSLLETNAPECSNIKFSTLFQDCAQNNCDPTTGRCQGSISCSGVGRSCYYLQETMQNILTETFDEWQIGYYFIATTAPASESASTDIAIMDTLPIGVDFSDACPGTRKAKVQPLPSDPPLNLVLFICD